MYTRKYDERDEPMQIPSGYDGIAIRQDTPMSECEECALREEECISPPEHSSKEQKDSVSAGLPLFGRLRDTLGFRGLALSEIGFEEILIGALALYLFFSKGGDRECAVMLVILLFVK